MGAGYVNLRGKGKGSRAEKEKAAEQKCLQTGEAGKYVTTRV